MRTLFIEKFLLSAILLLSCLAGSKAASLIHKKSVHLTNSAAFLALEPRTCYSLGSGAWEDNTRWSLSADGSSGTLPSGEFPNRGDNVVINSGHTITVNSATDNFPTGMKPSGLGKPNIGPFNAADVSDVVMFYHTGTILIHGTLSFSGIEAILGGYTWVQNGGLLGGSEILLTGNLEADAGSSLTSLDDLILTGNSITSINTNATVSDDLIIDHTDATLCGTGTTTLQGGAGSRITYSNGAMVSQLCTVNTVKC